jgi:hypothetical protein
VTEQQEGGQRISRQDMENVSRKLKELADELPESERAVLGLVLTRAQAAPDDLDPAEVARAAEFEQPFAGQLARAAGLFDSPQVTVVVGWSYRFGATETPEELINPPILEAGEDLA